jgi:hypothetical protein
VTHRYCHRCAELVVEGRSDHSVGQIAAIVGHGLADAYQMPGTALLLAVEISVTFSVA